MVKIQTQSGNSLADIYQVRGSIAGIEQLRTEELPIVHEMGSTVLSERMNGRVSRLSTGAIAQNIAFNIVDDTFPLALTRVLGAQIFSDNGGRVVNVTLNIHEVGLLREIPIIAWDSGEPVITARLQDNGAAVATVDLLQAATNIGILPSMLIGNDQRDPVGAISFRGLTTGFGAGVVTVTALLYLAFAQEAGGLGSRGLPLPSW